NTASTSHERKNEQGLIREMISSEEEKHVTEISANYFDEKFAKNHVTNNLFQTSNKKDHVILFSASKNKILLNLTSLYQKACDAEKQAIKVNQDEITCWYYYIIEFDNQVRDLMKSDNIGEKKAKGQIYDFIIAQLNAKRKTLQKQTQKARKVYNLFEKIGMDKIQYIKTYSADTISKFTNSQIQTIIDHFTKEPDIEFTDEQNNSSDDLSETEVSIPTESILLDSPQENDKDSELLEVEVSASSSDIKKTLPEFEVSNTSTLSNLDTVPEEETESRVSNSSTEIQASVFYEDVNDNEDNYKNFSDDGSFCGFSDDDDEGYYYDLNT
ncbi:248_t:CDS:1, partial [Ambispora gerdemannii]